MRRNEVWRFVDFSEMLTDALALPDIHSTSGPDTHFHCNIPGLDTYRLSVENGFFDTRLYRDSIPDKVIMMGLREACSRQPEFFKQYFGSCCPRENPYLQFNSDHFTDGIFVYVPDGVTVDKPIQLQSVVGAGHGLFIQVRNLVVLGRGSHATIVNCDDSYDSLPAFSNNVTEIYASEQASVEYYKLQNLNNATGLLNHTYAHLDAGAALRSVAVTLNGGHIRNHTEVTLAGEHCDVQAHGLYMADQEQQVDNYIFVDHAQPNCQSRELFKGILDDAARGTFNGHVLVRDGASKTEAYQSNRNILLTDKAFVHTKPFLEIYNDDVKCSHGSTIGQLDEQALFYIQSRGISQRTARTLLLYAFCDEVLQQIHLAPLRDKLSDLVKKRLHGELTLCSECALHCGSPCNGPDVNFVIDPSKL